MPDPSAGVSSSCYCRTARGCDRNGNCWQTPHRKLALPLSFAFPVPASLCRKISEFDATTAALLCTEESASAPIFLGGYFLADRNFAYAVVTFVRATGSGFKICSTSPGTHGNVRAVLLAGLDAIQRDTYECFLSPRALVEWVQGQLPD